MRKKFLWLVAIIPIALLLLACGGVAQRNSCGETVSDTLLGKHVVFPNNLLLLSNASLTPAHEYMTSIEGKAKIVSIIDGDCMKCIVTNMNVLDSLFRTVILGSDQQMVFILNVSPTDSAYFMRNLQPTIRVQGLVLWDSCYSFETANELFTSDINQRTFMLSPSDSIVMYGNPLFNPNLLHEYMANMGY